MGDLRHQLRAYLAARPWDARELDGAFAVPVEWNRGAWTVFLSVEEESATVLIHAVLPDLITADRRDAVALFLTRANFGLVEGNFELDLDDGELRYKATVQGGHSPLDHDLMDRRVATANVALDTYLPGILAVLDGADPAAALASTGES